MSAALILSYAVAPVTVAALRRNAPHMPRPFRVKGMGVLGPLSFIIAALIVYWSGWNTVSWLLGLQIVMFGVYLLCRRLVPTQHLDIARVISTSEVPDVCAVVPVRMTYEDAKGQRHILEYHVMGNGCSNG